MATTALAATKKPLPLLLRRLRHHYHRPFHSLETPLQHSIRTAIDTNNYHHIPHLFSSSSEDPNPFSFLSSLPPSLAVRVVDDILRSFLPVRPRSLPHPAYSALLRSLLLPSSADPPSIFLPLAFAVLQSSSRSGFSPPPWTRPPLSALWLLLRCRRHTAPRLISSIRDVGYRPDLRTCNFLLASLCSAGEIEEAIAVLRGLPAAGCPPDSESYCTVIEAACDRSDDAIAVAEGLLRKMVTAEGMTPRKGTVGRVVAAMRGVGEVRRAVEVVRFLGREGCEVGFEEYEAAAEGCLKGGELVMAGTVVVEMAERGFIPYFKVRQRVVEGLAGIGQHELACAVRQKLAEVNNMP